jgi:hypothetical protein
MAYFVIDFRDKPNAFEVRAAAREAHLAYIKELGAQVKLGGPYVDEQGRMIGSLIIVEADTIDEVRSLHDKDPYRQAGLFETSTITEWRLSAQNFA